MEPVLDETSLTICSARSPSTRIVELARTLKEFDQLGTKRVLRSVRDAADRDIGDGFGLRSWCFHRSTEKDAGRLVAARLASQPFIDGTHGLFAAAEGKRVVEATLAEVPALGAGLAALTEGALITLVSEANPAGRLVTVSMTYLDDDGERSEQVELRSFGTVNDVQQHRVWLIERIDRAVPDGKSLIERLAEMFPRLRLGDKAQGQIEALSGNEPVFRQLLRHLRALDVGALQWSEGSPFEPIAVSYSVESRATLDDTTLGAMRDFPTPAGFEAERWNLHTKLTGGAGARLYYRAVRTGSHAVVLIGYFGDHLPTVKYRT